MLALSISCYRTPNWFSATFILQNITDKWHPWLQHTFTPQWNPQASWEEKIITADLHFCGHLSGTDKSCELLSHQHYTDYAVNYASCDLCVYITHRLKWKSRYLNTEAIFQPLSMWMHMTPTCCLSYRGKFRLLKIIWTFLTTRHSQEAWDFFFSLQFFKSCKWRFSVQVRETSEK